MVACILTYFRKYDVFLKWIAYKSRLWAAGRFGWVWNAFLVCVISIHFHFGAEIRLQFATVKKSHFSRVIDGFSECAFSWRWSHVRKTRWWKRNSMGMGLFSCVYGSVAWSISFRDLHTAWMHLDGISWVRGFGLVFVVSAHFDSVNWVRFGLCFSSLCVCVCGPLRGRLLNSHFSARPGVPLHFFISAPTKLLRLHSNTTFFLLP